VVRCAACSSGSGILLTDSVHDRPHRPTNLAGLQHAENLEKQIDGRIDSLKQLRDELRSEMSKRQGGERDAAATERGGERGATAMPVAVKKEGADEGSQGAKRKRDGE
jgi:hypothetical protein